MTKITVVGAGGKMGCRLMDNFVKTQYQVACLEVSPQGIENLRTRNLTVSKQEEVIPQSDVVSLGVPDVAIEKVSAELI
ncbi:MAG: NAD(P)-binding domain-containing protein, partial [Cytophagales bacterium]|nr:NAD(P)-binding domain-containing protein [Cytophagales bacterium]